MATTIAKMCSVFTNFSPSFLVDCCIYSILFQPAYPRPYTPARIWIDCCVVCVVCCGLSGPSLPSEGNEAALHMAAESTTPTPPLVSEAFVMVLVLVGWHWRLPAMVGCGGGIRRAFIGFYFYLCDECGRGRDSRRTPLTT